MFVSKISSTEPPGRWAQKDPSPTVSVWEFLSNCGVKGEVWGPIFPGALVGKIIDCYSLENSHMEPEHHLFEKENHLNQTSILGVPC